MVMATLTKFVATTAYWMALLLTPAARKILVEKKKIYKIEKSTTLRKL